MLAELSAVDSECALQTRGCVVRMCHHWGDALANDRLGTVSRDQAAHGLLAHHRVEADQVIERVNHGGVQVVDLRATQVLVHFALLDETEDPAFWRGLGGLRWARSAAILLSPRPVQRVNWTGCSL